MKHFTSFIFLVLLTQSGFARVNDCRAEYDDRIIGNPFRMSQPQGDSDDARIFVYGGTALGGAAVGAAIWGATGSMAGTAASAGLILSIPAVGIGALVAVETVILIADIKEKRMVRLIDQASLYVDSAGKGVPGKLLKKFFKKVSKKVPDLSIYELANYISTSNADGTLCKASMPSFSNLVKNVNQGMIVIDGSQE